tara:strand:+ start:939 stop:1277 length:339 start_codon:yes stop_codon:yes gene_type:complete
MGYSLSEYKYEYYGRNSPQDLKSYPKYIRYNDGSNVRRSTMSNHIPAKPTRRNNDYTVWKHTYRQEISDILEIIQINLNNKFGDNDINFNNNSHDELSKIIYNCSSKYIPEY